MKKLELKDLKVGYPIRIGSYVHWIIAINGSTIIVSSDKREHMQKYSSVKLRYETIIHDDNILLPEYGITFKDTDNKNIVVE